MVGYHNTLPFILGLENDNLFDIKLDIPSKCMEYFDSRQVDIALVPVGNLIDRSDFEVITNYCIGCSGKVRTVSVFSNGIYSKWKKIYLDKDSRTSQKLVKILCERKWNINPEFVEVDVRAYDLDHMAEDEAILAIGDKVFEIENDFSHNYDLGLEWEQLTSLPFTFAVWIARKTVDPYIVNQLNQALSVGVNDIETVVEINRNKVSAKIDLYEYFDSFIHYDFDDDKSRAMKLFIEFNSASVEI